MTPWSLAVCLWTLTGCLVADDLITPDYLGSPSPVSTRGSATLPVEGPLAPSAGPSTAGGGGTVAGAALGGGTPGAAGTVTTSGSGGVALPSAAGPGLPETTKAALLALPTEQRASLMQQLQGLGGKFASMVPEIEKLFGDTTTAGPRDEAGFQAQRAGERADLSGVSAFGPAFDKTAPPFDLDPGLADLAKGGLDASGIGKLSDLPVNQSTIDADAVFGETGAEASGALGTATDVLAGAGAALKEFGILNSKGETGEKVFDTVGNAGQLVSTIYGGPVGGIAAGLVHQYISTPIVEAIFGKFGPSQAWKDFPINVGNTLRGTEAANQQLAVDLVNATTPEAQTAALQKFKAAVEAGGVGGFSGRGGDIPDEPGAGGSRHEGGIAADFTGEEVGLRAELDAARAGAAPEARLAALRDAMRGFFTAKDMKTPGAITEGALTPGQAANLSTVTGSPVASGDTAGGASALAAAIEKAKTASAATNESGTVTPPAELLAAYQQLTGSPYVDPTAAGNQLQYEIAQTAGGGGE